MVEEYGSFLKNKMIVIYSLDIALHGYFCATNEAHT